MRCGRMPPSGRCAISCVGSTVNTASQRSSEILPPMDQSPLAIHHVGVAVPSIDDAMHFYGDTLGLSLVDSLELPDRQLKVAFVKTANMLIELLEPTDPNSTV